MVKGGFRVINLISDKVYKHRSPIKSIGVMKRRKLEVLIFVFFRLPTHWLIMALVELSRCEHKPYIIRHIYIVVYICECLSVRLHARVHDANHIILQLSYLLNKKPNLQPRMM